MAAPALGCEFVGKAALRAVPRRIIWPRALESAAPSVQRHNASAGAPGFPA